MLHERVCSCFTLLLLQLFLCQVAKLEREVALIIGGSSAEDIELYTEDVNDNTDSCVKELTLPSLPSHLISASGIYDDRHGAVVCGGIDNSTGKESDKCFTFGPSSTDWEISSPGPFKMADMLR